MHPKRAAPRNRIDEHLTLYLVTDQAFGAEAFAALYERRRDVEIDIRNLKVI